MDDLISRQAAINELSTPRGILYPIRTIENMPPAEPDKRIAKIEDLVEGTIDHFDLEDAMDLLYQIKGVLK